MKRCEHTPYTGRKRGDIVLEVLILTVVAFALVISAASMIFLTQPPKWTDEQAQVLPPIVTAAPDTTIEERSTVETHTPKIPTRIITALPLEDVPIDATTTAEPVRTYLGEFKLYAFCPCKRCCGANAQGITASGAVATAGRTVSVDPSVIPLGSIIEINGHEYIAEDTGAGITGTTIDVFFERHDFARNFGVQYADVWLVEGAE